MRQDYDTNSYATKNGFVQFFGGTKADPAFVGKSTTLKLKKCGLQSIYEQHELGTVYSFPPFKKNAQFVFFPGMDQQEVFHPGSWCHVSADPWFTHARSAALKKDAKFAVVCLLQGSCLHLSSNIFNICSAPYTRERAILFFYHLALYLPFRQHTGAKRPFSDTAPYSGPAAPRKKPWKDCLKTSMDRPTAMGMVLVWEFPGNSPNMLMW